MNTQKNPLLSSEDHKNEKKPSSLHDAIKDLPAIPTHSGTNLPHGNTKPKWYTTRKGKMGIGIGIAILVLGGGIGWYAYAHRSKPAVAVETKPSASPTPEPTPVLKASLLTGALVDPAKADLPVRASIVENLGGPLPNAARPQSGLSTAGVIYEALSEGGISRYLAIWQSDVPSDIGPVRSMRPIFFDLAQEYTTPVTHAGGSTDGIARIQNSGTFRDLDHSFIGNAFRRITSRAAPHNLYINADSYNLLLKTKKWDNVPTFTAWARKDDSPAETPTASVITTDFSGPMYTSTYTYDKATNSYARTNAGVADVDAANNNARITPKTVIVLYTTTSYSTQANGKPQTNITITGSGQGVVFQDGTATTITWSKASAAGRMKFTGPDGQELKLNRGQSWVAILPTGRAATYK